MTGLKTWVAAAALTALGHGAGAAGTDLETAMGQGGKVLGANEIAELIIGKIVTAKSSDKEFRFYYHPDNVLDGEMVNGGWKGSGAFAITDTNRVCVSMAADKGRFRCLTVVRIGDTVQKFNAAGKMTFQILGSAPAEGL